MDRLLEVFQAHNIRFFFYVGGNDSQDTANKIHLRAQEKGYDLRVIGIPKTIDNDISFVERTFGFETAVTEAQRAIYAAHVEAAGARNGIGLVKLMGRDSGFIAAFASLVDSQVNFCLIPESPFSLAGFLGALERRLEERGHAVIAVAEGAGQDLLAAAAERDASGNVRYGDIGTFLRDTIQSHFARSGREITLKYIDPSYIIRSQPANTHDSALCLLLGHNAVHAGMSGRTNMLVGTWHYQITHVPIALATSARQKIDPQGWVWNSVLASTGQPREML
jgi:6-phosphofructokinase 1